VPPGYRSGVTETRERTPERTRPGWPGPTVGLLTVAWLVSLGAVTLDWLAASWAGTPDDRWLVVVLVGGPVLLTLTAIAGKLRGAAITFGVLAAVLAGLVAVGAAVQEHRRPPEPVPAHTYCVEFSGGDTRCPGG